MDHAFEYLGEKDDAKGKDAHRGDNGETFNAVYLHAYVDLGW